MALSGRRKNPLCGVVWRTRSDYFWYLELFILSVLDEEFYKLSQDPLDETRKSPLFIKAPLSTLIRHAVVWQMENNQMTE